MKTTTQRSRSHEARPRYDVTTIPKAAGDEPPSPPKPEPESPGSAMRAALARALRPFAIAWRWVRKPGVLLALACIGGAAWAWVMVQRSRPPAVEGPALPMLGWRASGYPNSNARSAIDGDLHTGWTTQGGQRATNWFSVDMRSPRKFHQVVMDSTASPGGYPRGYAVYVSSDGVHWGAPAARGEGREPVTVAVLSPQSARYIKVVQTDRDAQAWTICELTVH